VVRSNRASGATALAVRPGAAGVFSGNRVLSSVGLSVGQAEHTGERRSEPGVFPAQQGDELQRGTGRTLEGPRAVLEEVVDQVDRAAVEDELAGEKGAALEATADA
jgi:hypothetical protein